MKTTILSLVLASIAGLMYCSEESLAVTQEPEDKELRALLEARRGALKLVLETQRTRAGVGAGDQSFPGFARIASDLMNVELELAKTKEERIAIIEASLAIFVQIEQYREVQFKAALRSQSDFVFAKAERLKIEIELYKARKAP